MKQRPLTIAQLRLAAENGTLTPEDILACQWIRRARTIRVPGTKAADIVSKLAAQVRAYREDRHITVVEFAESIGCSASFISQIECGFKKSLTLDTMLRLAEGINAELICEFTASKKRKRA